MDTNFFLKNIIVCILFFLGCKSHAQNITMPEIERLRKEGYVKKLNAGDFKGAVLEEKELILKCKRYGYTKGEIKGYINIANALSGINRNKESLKFLLAAQKRLKKYEDDELVAKLHHVYGINYYSLGLYERAIRHFNKALESAKMIPDPKEREKRKYSVYDWKRSCFGFLGMMDSVYSNEYKCKRSPMPMLYITIAERHFKNKRIDSAEYYISKADRLLLTKNIPVEGKANVLRAYGRLSIEKKEYGKSLDYLLRSLKITQMSGLRKRTLESYKLLATTYKGLNDLEKENEYLIKYSLLNDSLRENEKQALNTSVEEILSDQEENYSINSRNFLYGFAGIILAGTAIIIIMVYVHNAIRKQKDALISQKDVETNRLRRKLDLAFEEVVQLAIRSDPSFIHKFKETYSEFYNNLIRENPELTANDILLCAFIKLNFSNKEIAEYAHLSIRTVESKKYRLRKKLDIPADLDFNKWIAQY